MTPAEVHRRGEGLRPARAGRGGFPHRGQVELPAPRRLAALRGGQRRRDPSRAPSRTARSWKSNPYQFLEGVVICLPMPCRPSLAYIYLRGEFWDLADALDGSIAELRSSRPAGGEAVRHATMRLRPAHPPRGRGLHLRRGDARCSSRWRASSASRGCARPSRRPTGLYGKPTVINNVETLTNLPPSSSSGAAWYRTHRHREEPGGEDLLPVRARGCGPGNYELPLGTTFRELIYRATAAGIPGGRPFKAIMPAGASSSLILAATDAVLDTPMDYESVAAARLRRWARPR